MLQQKIYGNIVDIVNKKVFRGCLSIRNGKIDSIEEIDSTPSKYGFILPGFIDSHIHIESTLLTPENFAKLAVQRGTLAVVTDPHEIANVLGVEGVDFMIQNGKKVRFHFNFGASPCVPSTTFETSGATLDSHQIAKLLQRDDIYGLAEMMNVPGVLYGDKETMAKINAARQLGKPIDGHAPNVSGDQLKQYFEAGVSTDHECTTLEEGLERIQLGMKVQIREGSAACDFEQLYPLLFDHPESVMFCTDDKYPDELANGHIDSLVARAIQKGVPLWNALEAACVTPVRHYHLKQGLLQPGDAADFIIVDNLTDFVTQSAFLDGVQVYTKQNGVCNDFILDKTPLHSYPNKFNAYKLLLGDLKVAPKSDKMKVIVSSEGSLLTSVDVVKPLVKGGNVISDTENDVLKIVCYNRYSEARPQIAFIRGFGLKRGAIASTIAHDSHNIIAIGTNDEDLLNVINYLVDIKGGLVVTDGDKMLDLSLPIAGLMSPRPGDIVGMRHKELKQLAKEIGCNYSAPFMTMAFMALPVIPELKLTDKGLFDGVQFQFTNLFVD